jgi:hypothetical protein
VGFGGILLVRRAVGDVRLARDQRGARPLGNGRVERLGDLVVIVSVDALHVPSVGRVARGTSSENASDVFPSIEMPLSS